MMRIEKMRFPAIPVNQSAFRTIDTPRKAYLLGFLLADGCVRTPKPNHPCNRVNLRIKSLDIKVCRMVQALAGGRLRLIEKGYRAEWEVYSSTIAADLISLGVTPRKTASAALNWESIPELLHGAVLAGLIDGDGYLRFNRKNRRAEMVLVTASATLKDQLLERFSFFKVTVVQPTKKRNCLLYRLEVGNNRQRLGALLRVVYEALPFRILDRKQAVLNQIRAYLADLDAYDERMGHVPAMKAAGLTIQQIADALGTSKRPVLDRLKQAGVDSKRVVYTQEDRHEIRRLHEQGMSVLEIHAAIRKGTEQAVRYHLQRMGCMGRTKKVQPRHQDADSILTEHKKGKPAYQIAAEKGICSRVVCRVLRQKGALLVGGSPQKLNDEQVEWAESELTKGRTLRSIAQELGVSETLIRFRRKERVTQRVPESEVEG